MEEQKDGHSFDASCIVVDRRFIRRLGQFYPTPPRGAMGKGGKEMTRTQKIVLFFLGVVSLVLGLGGLVLATIATPVPPAGVWFILCWLIFAGMTMMVIAISVK
jgi:hypothetical protein